MGGYKQLVTESWGGDEQDHVSVDSRQISPKVSLMLWIIDLVSLARLAIVSGKVWDEGNKDSKPS